MNEKALLVFSKVPRKGLVKRRLSAQIGTDRAFSLFLTLFKKTLSEAEKVKAERYLFLWPQDFNPEEVFSLFPGAGKFSLRPQSGQDLGERMKRALEDIFSRGHKRAVLVGTDIPELSSSLIEEAFLHLKGKDLVLGPARDGGYYLIGIRRGLSRWENLFEEISWGGPKVLEETLERASAIKADLFLLPELFDLDTEEDLKLWLLKENPSDKKGKRSRWWQRGSGS